MSDDRTNQLENLYAAPAGAPGETLFGNQGMLRNVGGLGSAIGRGVAEGAGQMSLQATQLAQGQNELTDTLAGSQDLAKADEADIEATKHRQLQLANWTRPNPYTSGIAQNTLYGVADSLTRAIPASAALGPLGGAAVFGGSTGMQAYNEATAQGIDSDTAQKIGLTQGAVAAAMSFFPMSFGGGVAKRMIAGSVLNTAYNEGGNLATAKILDDNGYHTQADQYKQMTGSAILSDIVMGSVFGGMHVKGREAMENPAVVDAAAQAAADTKYQVESAPGAPVDMASTQAHAQAMDVAREQLLRDEPVQLGDIHKDSTFIPTEDPTNRAQSVEALREAGYEPPAEPLTPADELPVKNGESPVEMPTVPADTGVKENLTSEAANEKQQRVSEASSGAGQADRGEPEPARDGEVSAGSGQATGAREGEQNAGRVAEGGRAGSAASGESTPEETVARQIAAEDPDKTVTYVDENGNEVTEKVSDALARVDTESTDVGKKIDAVKAAVACFLRFGE